MLWLALQPIQHRHTVVSFVITGAIWLMLICSAGSRGVSFGPQNRIDEVDDSERKVNARTKNHENFCGQDALPVLWA